MLAGETDPGGWQHRIEQVTITDAWNTARQIGRLDDFRAELDDLGAHGWELVAYHVLPLATSPNSGAATHLAVLKRPTGRPALPEPTSSPDPNRNHRDPHWYSEETRDALLGRWAQTSGEVPPEIERTLEAQRFLPADDWSVVAPCRVADDDRSRALLAVGSSWWILLAHSDGGTRFRVGEVSAGIGVEAEADRLHLEPVEGHTEVLHFESASLAGKAASFIRARQAALTEPAH